VAAKLPSCGYDRPYNHSGQVAAGFLQPLLQLLVQEDQHIDWLPLRLTPRQEGFRGLAMHLEVINEVKSYRQPHWFDGR
jgi:hypothetical protein